jgi:LemA protein
MELIIIFSIIFLFLIIAILKMYNKLIKLRNKVNQSESGIDVYLNQRFDLIPNLVECVKLYTKYESETLNKITELRSVYNQNKGLDIEKATELNNIINKILVVAENYPELKASEQYLNLQKNLSKVESQLQAARRIYNNDVTNYNTKIESIPNNIIAAVFGFKKAELFQIEEYKKENINIKL